MGEIRIVLTIKVEGADGATVALAPPESARTAAVEEDLGADVLDGVARAVRPHIEEFARLAARHGLRLVRPTGTRQDYRNVVAPGALVGSRIGSVHVRTGRLAVHKVPVSTLLSEEPMAQAFTNNGEPFGVKVYLDSAERVAAGVRLCRRAVELRGDVRARHV